MHTVFSFKVSNLGQKADPMSRGQFQPLLFFPSLTNSKTFGFKTLGFRSLAILLSSTYSVRYLNGTGFKKKEESYRTVLGFGRVFTSLVTGASITSRGNIKAKSYVAVGTQQTLLRSDYLRLVQSSTGDHQCVENCGNFLKPISTFTQFLMFRVAAINGLSPVSRGQGVIESDKLLLQTRKPKPMRHVQKHNVRWIEDTVSCSAMNLCSQPQLRFAAFAGYARFASIVTAPADARRFFSHQSAQPVRNHVGTDPTS